MDGQAHSSGEVDPQAQLAPRLPKLSYRVRNPETESIKTTSIDTSKFTTSNSVTSPLQSTFCPSPRESSGESANLHSPRSISIASSAVHSRRSSTINHSSGPKPTQKRPGFFSGFFGAKEPSAQAFAEYEKRLLKQGSGRTKAVGLPGVSSAKLPPTVPKVNSRWDGIPEALKEKEKTKDGAMQAASIKSMGSSTDGIAESDSRSLSTPALQRRPSRSTLGGTSVHSNGSNRLADLYGWETGSSIPSSSSSAVIDFASEHRPSTARLQTSHSAPAPSNKPPPLNRDSLFPPHIPPHHPTSPQAQLQIPSPGEYASHDVPSHSNSPAPTPIESSPATPNTPNGFKGVMGSNYESPKSTASVTDDLKTTVLEAPASFNEVVVRLPGPNMLSPPLTASWRAKAQSSSQEDDGPKTPRHEMPLPSILKKPATKAASSPSDSSFPETRLGPHTVHSRPVSARERLGLSPTFKNHAVAPWDSSSYDDDKNATDGEKGKVGTAEGGQLNKKKSRMFRFGN